MTEEKYLKKMIEHQETFDKLWIKIVADTNKFIDCNEYNPEKINSKLEMFIDNLSLSGCWIQDRLNGYSGNPGSNKYRKSLTRKIRKSLGYSL